MAFQPAVNTELRIEHTSYRVAEHPAAPGMPYGQEGRQAIVYQLRAEEEQRALKALKPRFRAPAMVTLSERIGAFAALPGLEVCKRVVLVPQRHGALLSQYPDLTYAVLMPWIQGPTWMEVLVGKRELSAKTCATLALSLVGILVVMEQRGLAHCDLSAANVLLPALASAAAEPKGDAVALVDVEGMYGPGLDRPREILSGSSGYAHKTAGERDWGPEVDRFAGAVLLGEMLGWCAETVRQAAFGESYFDQRELQQDCDRLQVLRAALRQQWGDNIIRLFEQAWFSETLSDCPTFGEWQVRLLQLEPRRPSVAVGSALAPGREALERGDWEYALAFFGEMVARGVYTSEAQAGLREARQQADRQRQAADSYRDALAAVKEGAWGAAEELIDHAVRLRPDVDYYLALQQAVAQRRNVAQEAEQSRLQAVAAMNRGDWTAAVTAAVQALNWLPGDAELVRVLSDARAAMDLERPVREALKRAELSGQRGDWEAVWIAASAALQQRADNAWLAKTAHEAEQQTQSAGAVEQAEKLASEGRWEEVLLVLENLPSTHMRAAQLRSGALVQQQKQGKIRAYADAAQQALAKGDWRGLREAAQAALALGTSDDRFAQWLQQAAQEQARSEQAAAAAAEASRLARAGNWDGALAAATIACKLCPQEVEFQELRARIERQRSLAQRVQAAQRAAERSEWPEVIELLADIPDDYAGIAELRQRAAQETHRQRELQACEDAIRTAWQNSDWATVVEKGAQALEMAGEPKPAASSALACRV